MARFKDFVLEEGPFWDAICHGVSKGMEAFKEKRAQQAKKEERPKPKDLGQKLLAAEGEELKSVIKQIVDNGFTIKQGKVQKKPTETKATDWLLECIRTKKASRSAR